MNSDMMRAIQPLENAFKARNEQVAKERIGQVDWQAWNQGACENIHDIFHSFATSLYPYPGCEDETAQLKFARRMLPHLAKAGCNILLDTEIITLLRQYPGFYGVYAQAHQRYGYVDKCGQTPLHWAAACALEGGNGVQACLRKGLDPNAGQEQGEATPYHHFWWGVDSAFKSGRVDKDAVGRMGNSMRALLQAGADPYADYVGITPWDLMQQVTSEHDVLRWSKTTMEAITHYHHSEAEVRLLNEAAERIGASRPSKRRTRL